MIKEDKTFNRTYKELKRRNSQWPRATKQTFNRTYKELKHAYCCWYRKYSRLLIEPIRNWNEYSFEGFIGESSFNRTYKELKLSCFDPLQSESALLIEPIRNWNFLKGQFEDQKANLLIEPIRNWNTSFYRAGGIAHTFNRTYKELKLGLQRFCLCSAVLLIEPIRNWNVFKRQYRTKKKPAFNRTYKELKHSFTYQKRLSLLSFNRTYKELKLCWCLRKSHPCIRF